MSNLNQLKAYNDIIAENHSQEIIKLSGIIGNRFSWELDYSKTLTIRGKGAFPEYISDKDIPWLNALGLYTNVIIETGIASIDLCTFLHCLSFNSISIPDSVTSISLSMNQFDSIIGADFRYIAVSPYNTEYLSEEGILYNKDQSELICYPCEREDDHFCIPEGVTRIGSCAFFGCKLKTVSIPDSVTSIGDYAFAYSCSITSITIPRSVNEIGENAFKACIRMNSIYVSEKNTKFIAEEGVLYSNAKTHLIFYPPFKKTLYFHVPEQVLTTSAGIFSDCSYLRRVEIPKGVTDIGEDSFADCFNLESIDVSQDNSEYMSKEGVLYSRSRSELVRYPSNKNDTIFHIPMGVEGIAKGAFANCEKLQNIIIPEGVKIIEDDAFIDCKSLKVIIIPKSVIKIGERVFRGCKKLQGVKFLGEIQDIGDEAFTFCICLKNITIPNSIVKLGNMTFYGCDNLVNIRIPEGVKSIGDSVFSNCKSLQSITIPKSVISIGNGVFTGCESLATIHVSSDNDFFTSETGVLYSKNKEILIRYPPNKTDSYYRIPGSVTNIANEAFENCVNICNVTIPENVNCIGDYAFFSCTKLQNIIIPESITVIGNGAFLYCSNLKSVTLAEGVKNLGNDAFSECINLKNFEIPNSVDKIGFEIFSGCTALENIRVKSNNKSFTSKEGVLFNINKSVLIYYPINKPEPEYLIPEGVQIIGDHAFGGNVCLKTIAIPESVTRVEECAFCNCHNLHRIKLPNSVEYVGKLAFFYCRELQSIVISENIKYLGREILCGCDKLQNIELTERISEIMYNNCTCSECDKLEENDCLFARTVWRSNC